MSPAMATTPTMRHFIKVKVDMVIFSIFQGKKYAKKKSEPSNVCMHYTHAKIHEIAKK